MPVVRMLQYISGGRHDGRDWPDPQRGDGTIDVADWEAQDLIRGRLAVPAGGGTGGGAGSSAEPAPQAEAPVHNEPGAGAYAAPEPEPAPVAVAEPAPVAPPEVSPVTEVSPVAGVAPSPAAELPGVPDAATLPEPVEETVMEELPAGPPNPHDIKQRWVDYAITRGEDPAIARDMTKADLMSKHGGRL